MREQSYVHAFLKQIWVVLDQNLCYINMLYNRLPKTSPSWTKVRGIMSECRTVPCAYLHCSFLYSAADSNGLLCGEPATGSDCICWVSCAHLLWDLSTMCRSIFSSTLAREVQRNLVTLFPARFWPKLCLFAA